MSSVVSFIKTRHSHTVSRVYCLVTQLCSLEEWSTWNTGATAPGGMCTILHKIMTGELILQLFNNISTDSLFPYSCHKQGLKLSKKHRFETLTKVRTPALRSVIISNGIGHSEY